MKIAIIDGQGGGIGKALTDKIIRTIQQPHELIVLGTNDYATQNMLQAGAHKGFTGENAIVEYVSQCDIVAGPLAIMVTDSMMGEITTSIAQAVARSGATKVILPLNRCRMVIAGTTDKRLSELIDVAVREIQLLLN